MTVYQSPKWTFFPKKQEIVYLDGEKKQLPSRISKCLLTLLSNAGSVVTYDELLKEVWGTTHKEASTISSVVSEVRKLIGSGDGDEKMIVTVPKRGYRYTYQVQVYTLDELTAREKSNENLLSTNPAEETITNNEPIVSNRLSYRFVMITLLIIVSVYSLLNFLNLTETNENIKDQAIPASSMQYEVLSHESGREDEFDISDDGLWLTYVNKRTETLPSLKVKELETGKVQQITAEAGSYFGSPVFSSDTNRIVYHKQTDQSCEVWILDFSTKLLEASNAKYIANCGKGGFWSTTSFSKDGHHVYYSRAHSLTDPFKVFRLDLRTSFERNITSPTSSGRGDYSFSLSPSGQQLAVIRNVLWQESHILVNNVENNESKLLLKLPYLTDRIGWLSNEQIIYCDRDSNIWSYNLATEKQSLMAELNFTCNYPVVSQEQIYAIKKVSIKNAIWSLIKKDNGDFAITPLITSPYYDSNAMFGPDETLYFISNRSGKEQLWQKTPDGFIQYKGVNLPPNTRELEFSIETNTLYGLSEQRLFRYNLDIAEIEWISKEKHQVFNFSIADNNQLIFSEGKDEYWTLKSIDLFTLKITNLKLNAFSSKQYEGELFFTQYHEQGLWKKNLETGIVEKVLEKVDIKFNTFWDIWDKNTLIWATDKKFKIYDLNSGQLLYDNLNFEGHIGFLKCKKERLMCTFSFRENNETEIIKLKSI
ncbi:hypothetical protein HII17_03675 [Thalassotalea sp. M1531]|uniref:OmpR/PhoB-type domain-containing protein n=1 Tax=Thalassotalea algicola TaxID=2716224 RepID=A0A7Y0LAJ2_9GAMM|nr:winged helix-turn-helix domain-containing protein [Thalassotalea algicola]NMP30653.1 hypothetical protein [Thalassotalea algicola]